MSRFKFSQVNVFSTDPLLGNPLAVVHDADALTTEAATRDNVLAIVADVSSPDDTARMVTQTLDWAGQIDGLVNNAGVVSSGEFLDITEEDFDRVMDINVKGMFLASQASLRCER